MNNNYGKRKPQEGPDPKIKKLSGEANKAERTQIARQLNMNVASSSTKPESLTTSVPLKTSCGQNESIDKYSCMGRFGWTSLGNEYIPYLTRLGENYCSVLMLEMKVLNKWLECFCKDLYDCTNVASYYITGNEARLLNQIAHWHCNSEFGRKHFKIGDLIVRLADACEFYHFLKHCHDMLANKTQIGTTNRSGFIRINNESVVPFTVHNGQRYVPLFYFEGELNTLNLHAEKVEGWDLSYLKFCFKVQGIRNEMFEHDFCSVVCLDHIKNYFPPGTVFEDHWPEDNRSRLLLSDKLRLPQNGQWIRKPAIRILQPAANSISPLSGFVTTIPGRTNIIVNQNPDHQAYATAQILQPSSTLLNNNGPNMTAQKQVKNKATKKIPTVPSQKPKTVLYKMQTATALGKMFKVINFEPCDFTVCLVTLQDLANNLFIGASAQDIQQALQVLKIDVYEANAAQKLVLMKQGKCQDVNEAVALVDFNKVLHFMTALRFMLHKEEQIAEERQETEK